MPKTLRIPLRIVFYKEDGVWIAHCLEFDLIGDGSTPETALERLGEAIRIQIQASIEHNNPANLFSSADGKYFQMWAAGNDFKCQGRLALPGVQNYLFEPEDCRQYDDSELACV